MSELAPQTRYPRRETRQLKVGNVAVGGGAPISVQSMTTTKTADVEGTLQQIYALAGAGCASAGGVVPSGAARSISRTGVTVRRLISAAPGAANPGVRVDLEACTALRELERGSTALTVRFDAAFRSAVSASVGCTIGRSFIRVQRRWQTRTL